MTELAKAAAQAGRVPAIGSLRDKEGHEIDAIVESGNLLHAIEAESGQTVPTDAFKSLDFWRPKLPPGKTSRSWLIHGGDSTQHRENVTVLPWHGLAPLPPTLNPSHFILHPSSFILLFSMPFDQKTRNLPQRTVSACRRILGDEFASQRRGIFGINDDGAAAPRESLGHLPDEDMQTARLLRDRLDHPVAGLTAHGKKEAVGRLAREQSFTMPSPATSRWSVATPTSLPVLGRAPF